MLFDHQKQRRIRKEAVIVLGFLRTVSLLAVSAVLMVQTGCDSKGVGSDSAINDSQTPEAPAKLLRGGAGSSVEIGNGDNRDSNRGLEPIEAPPEQAFSFVLMNVHIDPDDTHVEFEALREMVGETYANHRGEDDFILLGDMNEEPGQCQPYQWMQNQRTLLPSELKTNAIETKAYDNLVFDASCTAEFRNQAGVMNLIDVYQLTLPQAKLVSDHFPVWGVFSSRESPRAAMTQSDSNEVIG